jgi:acyl-CoA thioesterase FadM
MLLFERAKIGAVLLIVLQLSGIFPVGILLRQLIDGVLRVMPSAIAARWERQAISRDTGSLAKRLLLPFVVSIRCWPTDCDFWGHMNNVQYNRWCELGRFKFLMETGIGWHCHKTKVTLALASCSVRFRRELKPFQLFQLETTLSGYDNRTLFLEHRFVGMSDRFCHAHALSAVRLPKRDLKRGVTPASILQKIAPRTSAWDATMMSKGVEAQLAFDSWSSDIFSK